MASVMRAGALSRGSALSRVPRTLGAVRRLNLHEYQSAQLMAEKGVNVPMGIAAKSVAEAVAAAAKIGDDEVVIKSQILAGGRGLGTFKNGFQGGVHVIKTSQVEEYAGKMLGQTLVTKQSGPEGKPVDTLLLAKKMQLVNEMYFAIMLDRATLGPMIIACSEGGTSIEDLAASSPEKIIKVPISIAEGITDAQAATVVDGLKVSGDKKAAAEQIKALYKLFVEADCTMVEVNPLAEDADGKLIAADAKVGFDDNASFRQAEIFAQRDVSQEDPREVAAEEWDLNYMGLDGNIGCMVNGAGQRGDDGRHRTAGAPRPAGRRTAAKPPAAARSSRPIQRPIQPPDPAARSSRPIQPPAGSPPRPRQPRTLPLRVQRRRRARQLPRRGRVREEQISAAFQIIPATSASRRSLSTSSAAYGGTT